MTTPAFSPEILAFQQALRALPSSAPDVEELNWVLGHRLTHARKLSEMRYYVLMASDVDGSPSVRAVMILDAVLKMPGRFIPLVDHGRLSLTFWTVPIDDIRWSDLQVPREGLPLGQANESEQG